MDFISTHPHYLWALFGFACFPRITLWFFSLMTGGFLFWLGVLFVPRIMIAYWGTHYYWDTDPFLCVCSWFLALGGTKTETKVVVNETSKSKASKTKGAQNGR